MHDATTMPAAGSIDAVGPAPQRMQCMEVWGGNQVVDHGVNMAGLDAWIYSRPFGEASGGGDVHYVSSCASGRITRLLLADVSGHGQSVSEIAAQLRALMYQNVNYLDQTRLVRAMNRQFIEMSKDNCFATAIVTTFFAPTNDLSLSNAGHPPPLLYRAARKEWIFLDSESGRARKEFKRQESEIKNPDDVPSNIPLGIMELAGYEKFGIRLKVGDLVLCYTDSLPESRETDGTLLGQEGLLRIVREIGTTDPPTFIPALLDAIRSRAAGNLTEDDVTALLFRPNGMVPRVPMGERLKAPLRVVGGMVGSLRRRDRPIPWPEMSLPNIGGAMFHPFNRLWSRRNQSGGTGAEGSED